MPNTEGRICMHPRREFRKDQASSHFGVTLLYLYLYFLSAIKEASWISPMASCMLISLVKFPECQVGIDFWGNND